VLSGFVLSARPNTQVLQIIDIAFACKILEQEPSGFKVKHES